MLGWRLIAGVNGWLTSNGQSWLIYSWPAGGSNHPNVPRLVRFDVLGHPYPPEANRERITIAGVQPNDIRRTNSAACAQFLSSTRDWSIKLGVGPIWHLSKHDILCFIALVAFNILNLGWCHFTSVSADHCIPARYVLSCAGTSSLLSGMTAVYSHLYDELQGLKEEPTC